MASQRDVDHQIPNGAHQNGFNKDHQVVVVVIPLPAQGHITPILHFSHRLASHHIPVHFVGSATHNRQAKLRVNSTTTTNNNNIMFHDLIQFPLSFPCSKEEDTGSNFPVHLQRLFQALSYLLRHPVSQLLGALAAKFRRVVVIHDSLMASVVEDIESIPNAESYTFHTSSAFTIFFTIWESLIEKPFELGPDIPKDVPSFKGWTCPEFDKFVAKQYKLMSLSSGRLYNTCRVLEGKYVDLMSKLPVNENKKLFAIGPISPLCKTNPKMKHWCLDWLDQQEKDSVIYVSFGTTISMKDEQIRELAIGLEKSDQKFIWVLREADKVNIFEEEKGVKTGHDQLFLEGFENRVRNRGIVVRDWAPQMEILGHPSTGGFLSHCGWNSCIESLSLGVPIAAWPMHSDQPKNSFLVTEVLKVGVVVRDWSKQEEVVKASVVEKAVRKLMGTKEGNEIRKRANELGVAVRGSTAKGGTSALELDSFVGHITR